MIEGRCPRGAVGITVTRTSGEVGACHCARCRRWGGGIMAGFVAAAFPLLREVYADRAHRFAALSGDHPRITRAGYEQTHPHVEGNA